MVLDKLPGPGRPTILDKSRARAYCTCSRCGWGLFGHFTLICPFSFLSPSLWDTTRYRLKYCLKGSLSPKTTNQPKIHLMLPYTLLCAEPEQSRRGWVNTMLVGFPPAESTASFVRRIPISVFSDMDDFLLSLPFCYGKDSSLCQHFHVTRLMHTSQLWIGF